MSSRGRAARRWWPLVLCGVLFAAGVLVAVTALRGEPPPPTPVPDREFSLTREEVLALDPEAADAPVALPTGDLGPYVRTSPVEVPEEDSDEAAEVASHVYIPSIFVSAPVVGQGVTSSNEMALPDDLHQVGLLETTAPLAAEEGSTLVAGHVTAGGHPGALYLLGRLRPGASVVTVDAVGQQTRWAVASVRSFRKTSLPPEIFDPTGERVLTLVTCGGEIVQTPDGRWTHEDNIVVTAVPAG